MNQVTQQILEVHGISVDRSSDLIAKTDDNKETRA